MRGKATRLLAITAGVSGMIIAIPIGAIVYPQPFFAYHTDLERLTLYSDLPFDNAAAQRILADVEVRLQTSSITDHRPHMLFIANEPWREALLFNRAMGAAGVNYYPLSNNVFLRRSNIDRDIMFGPSGRPASAPRTLAYYAAHEITHSFTAERLGIARLWNFGLPQWVREGYADYVGLRGPIDLDDLWRRYQAGDPEFDYDKSGLYTRFLMLTAFILEREHWSVDQLLASRITEAAALALMSQHFTARR